MNLTIPNLLSLLRMGLLPLFVIAVFHREPERALALFLLAGVTDMLDGLIARYFGQESPLGAYLDPIADKLLLMTAFVILAIPDLYPGLLVPVWVTVIVIARDVLILVIALVFYLSMGQASFPPSGISKATTLAQIVAVGLVLGTGVWKDLEATALVALYLATALTVVSGLNYVARANRMIESPPGEPSAG